MMPFSKINEKWIIDLMMKCKTIKCIKEMRNVHKFEFNSDFQVRHQEQNLFLKLGFDFIINLKKNVLQKTQLRK